MKKLILTLILIALASASAFGGQLKQNSAACGKESELDELIGFFIDRDLDGVQYMIESGRCIITSKPLKASRLNNGFSVIKIRVYFGSQSMTLFTARENFKK